MRKKYYDKRQIIDVSNYGEIDFEEDILICIPRFAWIAARSYLSVQAQWLSSFAVEYFDNSYETPSPAQFDKIQANIARFLGEVDMSCDLEEGLQKIADELAALVAKQCSINLACNTGSGGASGVEAIAETYEDIGVDPPFGFDDYGTYEAYKCGVAQMIVDQFEADLEYIKDLALSEISILVLAGTLLSPIPGDEVGALVGAILVWISEATLDALLSEVITAIIGDGDQLVCDLFLSIDVPGAKQVFSNWGTEFLSVAARFVTSFWNGNDVINQLFQNGNFILPSSDCAGCAVPASSLRDTFTDDDGVTLVVHTPDQGGPWLTGGTGTFTIDNNQAKCNGATGSRILISSTLANAVASLELSPTSGGSKAALQGVIARGSDGDNYIAGGWTGGSSAGYWIGKRVSGSWIELDFVSAPSTYETRTIQLTCDGSSISLEVSGVPKLSVTETFNQTETDYGIMLGQASGSRVDNFLVDPL